VSISWHQQDEERLRIRPDGRSDVQGTDVGTFGLWGQMNIPSDTGLWTGGAELYRDNVNSFRHDFNEDGSLRSIGIQGPVADDAHYTTAAAFLQHQYSFGNAAELTSGLRYTWSKVDAAGVQDPVSGERISIADNWSDLTGSMRLTRRLDSLKKSASFCRRVARIQGAESLGSDALRFRTKQ
jgi:hemoglobin/transferrin/lactoferrin receptor protein